MRPLSKMLIACFLVTTMAVAASGCTTTTTTTTTKPVLLLATTSSLYDTGLLNYLEPIFEQQYNVDLQITSQGTGKALEIASRGDADVLAVHSPSQEATYMASGKGLNQRCFAINYYVIIGPASDPAGIKGMNATAGFQKLYQLGTNNTAGVQFVSRGDDSGTHTKEKDLWKAAGYNYTNDIRGSGAWYIEAGKTMGETLQLANEKKAYTLSDEGTFLSYKTNLDLVVLIDTGKDLLNRYSVITVYNEKFTEEEIKMANNFVNFMISNDTQQKIGQFGVDKYGKALFTPMNGQCSQYNCDCTRSATQLVPTLVNATANATKTATATLTATANATKTVAAAS